MRQSIISDGIDGIVGGADFLVTQARNLLGAPVEAYIKAVVDQWLHAPTNMGGASGAREYTFYVALIPNSRLISKIKERSITVPPFIRSWMVKSITIPKYNFRGETIQYGATPRTITVIEGGNIPPVKIKFLEDNIGSIQYLESWLQRTIINGLGVHNPPIDQKLFHIMCLHFDTDGYPIGFYLMRDCGYAQSGDTIFDTDKEGFMERGIDFTCDKLGYMNTAFWGINSIAKGVNKILDGTKDYDSVSGLHSVLPPESLQVPANNVATPQTSPAIDFVKNGSKLDYLKF